MPQKTIRIFAVAAALGVTAWGWSVFAEGTDDGPQDKPEGRSSQDGPPRRPPPPPLEVALDLNDDHEISADELDAATASLKKLDKNGDGKLTPEEYRPPRPNPMGRGPNAGPGPRDSEGMRRGPRDGDGPAKKRGPRDIDSAKKGDRAKKGDSAKNGEGAKGDGDCPEKSSAEKQKSEGQSE